MIDKSQLLFSGDEDVMSLMSRRPRYKTSRISLHQQAQCKPMLSSTRRRLCMCSVHMRCRLQPLCIPLTHIKHLLYTMSYTEAQPWSTLQGHSLSHVMTDVCDSCKAKAFCPWPSAPMSRTLAAVTILEVGLCLYYIFTSLQLSLMILASFSSCQRCPQSSSLTPTPGLLPHIPLPSQQALSVLLLPRLAQVYELFS